MPLTNYIKNRIIDHVVGSATTPFVTTTTVWCSLHTATPTASATASPLASCPRFQVIFGAAASATAGNNATGSVVTSASGTVTDVALWDGSATATANPLWYGSVAAEKAVNAGDTVTLAIAGLTVSLL